jgi:hypothetical protein
MMHVPWIIIAISIPISFSISLPVCSSHLLRPLKVFITGFAVKKINTKMNVKAGK